MYSLSRWLVVGKGAC